MVDKQTIDRSIKEALDNQDIEQLHREQKENLGAESQAIQDTLKGIEAGNKTNKLLNLAQIGEIALNFKRDQEAADVAASQKDFEKKQKKHNIGAKASRSRIEGGIKDIKEMMGIKFDSDGNEIPERTTNTQYLKDVFSELAGGQGIGNSRSELDANNMMASFASQATGDLDKFAEVMEKADKDDRRELVSALNKVSDVAAGKAAHPLSKSREEFEKSPILKELGVTIDPKRASFLDAMRMEPNDKKGQADRNQRFKDLRRMSDEGRLTKANPIVGGRSGVDLETMPEKNYEVLVDIYELLEKWYNEYDGMNTGGSGSNFPIGSPTQLRRTPRAVRTPNPSQGFKHGGQNRVQAKSGRFYNASSPQGKAIIAAQNAPKPAAAIASATPNTAGSVAKTGKPSLFSRIKSVLTPSEATKQIGKKAMGIASKIATPLSAVLEGYDTYEDIQVAKQRAELGENDEAFLTEEALEREKTAEKLEGVSRFGGGTVTAIAGAKGGAMAGAALGSFVPVIGTAAGAVVGGIVGGVGGYIAGSEAGEAISGVAAAWNDDDLEAAQDSGLYNWEGWGNSILDKSKLADAPSPQLQAIIRHNDLSEDDMKSVLEELSSRGGDTSLAPSDGTALEMTEGGPAELENATVPTADAVGNTMEAFEEANGNGRLEVSQVNNNNTTSNTTVEKGEGFLVQGPSTNDSDLSWMGKRNYVASWT